MDGGGGTLPSASSAEPGSRSQPGDAEGVEGGAGYTDEWGITFGADGLITQEWPSPAAGPSSSTDRPGETMRSQMLKEVQLLEQALDSYRDRMTSYNEEELEEERQTFFAKIIASLQSDSVLDDGAPQFANRKRKAGEEGETKVGRVERTIALKEDLAAHSMRLNMHGAAMAQWVPALAAANAAALGGGVSGL
jgi:hypothetical protein